MYQWPLETLLENSDQQVKRVPPRTIEQALRDGGYGDSVVDFLTPLYEQANGATFYDGAFRIIPLAGFKKHKVPGVVEWNDPSDWKSFGPKESAATFFFCANSFGDQFGIPLTKKKEIGADKLAILWVEKYTYEQADSGWSAAADALVTDDDVGKYLARLAEYEWAVEELAKPEPWQCFSSKVPAILGGDDTIDNVEIRSMPVHVSFTLQVIKQNARKKGGARQ